MEPGFWIAIGSLSVAILLGLSLARYNLKVLRETKQQRLEARRAYKKKKNAALKKWLGL